MMYGKSRFAAIAALLLPLFLEADELPPAEFDPIVVVASKRPVPLSEVAGQISVITAEDIAQDMVDDLDQLLRYEPGVDIVSGGTRFGAESVTIRGIGGNRVAIELDGAPIRNGFAIGSYANAGRALIETDRVERVEILHGPASTLFGSDALGGVLSFTTWDPEDLVNRGDGDYWIGLRTGYQSADGSWLGSGQAAWIGDAHGALVSATLRDGSELDSGAVGRSSADPQQWSTSDYALRYTFDTPTGQRLRVDVSRYERDARTDVRSLVGHGRFSRTTSLVGDDLDRSSRLLADYSFHGRWFDSGVVRAYLLDTRTEQHTDEVRGLASLPVRIERDFRLESRDAGIEMVGFRNLVSGPLDHRLGIGVEWLHRYLEESRDGFEQDLATGEILGAPLGETLPTRDFPNSTTRQLGLFVEDAIQFGAWEVTPALRLERYHLSPETDAVFRRAFPDTPVVSVDEGKVTPRLSFQYAFDDDWSVYGQVAEGFRAPPVEDVNIGFEIALFRYRAIPNPDLESETSRGYEFGLRRFTDGGRLALTGFHTDYRNLIVSRAPRGVDPDTGYLEFQSRNVGEARIYGFDLRFEQALGHWRKALDNWSVSAAAFWSRGEDESNGRPLNSVLPPQAVLGARWSSPDEVFDAHLAATFTARQERVDTSAGDRFVPPAWQALDLTAGWRFTPRMSFRAGVFNLTDEVYWRWQDVSALPRNDPMIPLLAQPGRNYQLTLRLEL